MEWWAVCNVILAVGIFFMMVYSDLREADIQYRLTGDFTLIKEEVVYWTALILLFG